MNLTLNRILKRMKAKFRFIKKAPSFKRNSVLFISLRFSVQHALLSIILLFILITIALIVTEPFIRTFLGDVLVIIWMYLCVATFIQISPKKLSLLIVTFAFCVEISQYFQVLTLLNIDSKLMSIILGSTYDPLDFLAYIIGGFCCLISKLSYMGESP